MQPVWVHEWGKRGARALGIPGGVIGRAGRRAKTE